MNTCHAIGVVALLAAFVSVETSASSIVTADMGFFLFEADHEDNAAILAAEIAQVEQVLTAKREGTAMAPLPLTPYQSAIQPGIVGTWLSMELNGRPFDPTYLFETILVSDSVGTEEYLALSLDFPFDGQNQRGFYAGDDGILWTDDDVEVTGWVDDVDGVVIAGYHLTYEHDTPGELADLDSYFQSETEVEIYAQFDYFTSSGFLLMGRAATMDLVVIPEPASVSIGLVGLGVLLLRRQR